MKKLDRLLMIILVVLVPGISQAANKFVRPGATGNGSGTDWTNAYTNLPSSLTRGDTYYLAAGTYGNRTFNDPVSGTAVITIKKATATDHGADVGWSSAYGSGQAVFSGWQIYSSYYVFDGQTRNADWRTGGVNQYGITAGNTRLDNGAGVGANNLTFRYVDLHGGGRDTGNGDDVIYGLTGNSNITFQYCALRDSDRTIFLMRGNWKNLLVDHSYMARNTSTPATHGELLSMTDSDGVTFSNNAFEDIEGTAFFAALNNGVASNWKIYGNTFTHTASYIADTGRKSGHNFGTAGIVYCANDASNNNTCNNFLVYNNTAITLKGTYSGVVVQKGSGNITQNNIWYDSVRTGGVAGTTGWNWFYNTVQDGDSSSTKVVCTSNCNLFANLSGKDFHLASATPAGTTLSSPFNVDPDGVTRGSDGAWDRGAFEFGGKAPIVTVNPPANLRVTP